MKHLVGKTIEMKIVEEGLMYVVVVDRYTVEVINSSPNTFEMAISPTGVGNVLCLEVVVFDTLIEALEDADLSIEWLLKPEAEEA